MIIHSFLSSQSTIRDYLVLKTAKIMQLFKISEGKKLCNWLMMKDYCMYYKVVYYNLIMMSMLPS